MQWWGVEIRGDQKVGKWFFLGITIPHCTLLTAFSTAATMNVPSFLVLNQLEKVQCDQTFK